MADFYALPTLTAWVYSGNADARTGWSNTSGGPNIAASAALPGSNDRVFFDANSGPSREISVANTVSINSLSTVGAASMSFTGSGIYIYPNSATSVLNLTGTSRVENLIYLGWRTSTMNLYADGVRLEQLMIGTNCVINTDLNVGSLQFFASLDSSDNYYSYLAIFKNVNVSVDSLNWDGAGGGSIYMGSGTWTVKSGYSMLMYTNANVYPQGCTVCLDLTSNPSSGFYFNPVSHDYNLWIKRTVGVLTFGAIGNFANLTSWRIDPGCNVTLPYGTYTARDFNFKGFPNSRISIKSSSTSPSLDIKLRIAAGGPARITLDYCDLTNVNAVVPNTFFGRQCTYVQSNVIPYFAAPGFAAFF